MHKFKIISLGLSQSNFLTQLYSEVKKREDKFTFHVNDFKDLSQGNLDYNKQVFDSKHCFHKKDFSKIIQFQVLISLFFKNIFWVFLWFELRQGKNINQLIKFIKKEVKTKARVDKVIVPLGFDIYHFHFCIKENLKFLHYLPKGSRIVCSFWGSDLYRVKDSYNGFYVQKALEKASRITIQTPEMGADLFKVYGSHIKKKMVYAQFAIETEIYKLIDLYQNDDKKLSEFKETYGIPTENIVLTIGYNANVYFGHIEILDHINQLDKSIKKQITCVLPLTYSRNEEYLKKLYNYIDLIDVNVVCFDSFIPHEDIAKLRLVTDIQIQLPVSDALSASVTEVLYAGNTVIAGDWLPYGIFKRNEIPMLLIDSLDSLKIEITRLIDNPEQLKSIDVDIKSKIENSFFPDATTKAWLDLYNDILV